MVPVDGQRQGEGGDDHEPHVAQFGAGGQREYICGEDLIEDVESDDAEHDDRTDDDDTAVAELGPRLDHLRQAELRSLRGVKRREDGADGDTRHDGQQ